MNEDQQIRLLILLIARAADVATTRFATADLSAELNPIVRAMGWRYWIASNVVLCLVLCPLPMEACALVAAVSCAVALWNLRDWRRRQ